MGGAIRILKLAEWRETHVEDFRTPVCVHDGEVDCCFEGAPNLPEVGGVFVRIKSIRYIFPLAAELLR